MRAGNMDKSITIQRITYADNPAEPWIVGEEVVEDIVVLRAQRIQSSTEEFRASYGTGGEDTAIFRTRYNSSVLTTDSLIFETNAYDIKELKEIGRRQGLEIRCERAAA